MSPRASLVLGLLVVGSSACTVVEDMNGYSGGPDDSAAPGSDTSVVADTAISADSTPPEDSSAPTIDTSVDEDTGGAPKDTGTPPADSFVADTFVADTFVADTFVADTFVADTFVADTGSTTDAPPCGAAFVNAFGLSEIMVRAISGTGDKREWLELTNYSSGTLDVSGVTVKIVGSGIEKASLTFPSGTSLAAGEAVVVAVDKATFVGDLTTAFATIKVFDFAKLADVMTNGTPFDVRLLGPGCTTPYESVTVSRGTWPVAQSFAYPPPSATCSVAGRLTATNTLSTPWKDTTKDAANNFGNLPADGGTTPLYGTPGKTNTGVVCP